MGFGNLGSVYKYQFQAVRINNFSSSLQFYMCILFAMCRFCVYYSVQQTVSSIYRSNSFYSRGSTFRTFLKMFARRFALA